MKWSRWRLTDAIAIDALLLGIAHEFNATEYDFPQTLSLGAARRAGYFEQHPHLAVLTAHVPRERDAMQRFVRDEACELTAGDSMLSPAICLHYWTSVSNSHDNSVRIGTASGPCARQETEVGYGLERLTRFRMREVFAVGPRAAITEIRQTFLDVLRRVAKELDLSAAIVTGADSFYLGDAAMRRLFQLNMELKHELAADLGYASEPLSRSNFSIAPLYANTPRPCCWTPFASSHGSGSIPAGCCRAVWRHIARGRSRSSSAPGILTPAA